MDLVSVTLMEAKEFCIPSQECEAADWGRDSLGDLIGGSSC